jgi:release factor glutamine methyltransferase
VPRPETELLVELALARIAPDADARVLDLGTGSGAIALAIARERQRARVPAVDASAPALAIAQRNAARLGLERVRLLRSDWFSAVRDEAFELVLANPPYLADDDPHLREGSLPFEPALALASGRDGLMPCARSARTRRRACGRRAGCCSSMAWRRARRRARCCAPRASIRCRRGATSRAASG